MNLDLRTTKGVTAPAEFLAEAILKKLQAGKKVLWFATGGSSIAVAVEVSKILAQTPHGNLTVSMTDERYGDLNHPDSNWYQMMQKGFNLPQAKLIPILIGQDSAVTTDRFDTILTEAIDKADYKIALFGIGSDGHTCGILPDSVAVDSPNLACGYKSEKFERITITPKAILRLDEGVAYMQGEEKWKVIEDLRDKEIELIKQPAQILKKIPLLTIFSDYEK